MIEFIVGFAVCYLLLTGIAIHRSEVLTTGNPPFLIKLQFTIMVMVVMMPALVWHASKNMVFGLERIDPNG